VRELAPGLYSALPDRAVAAPYDRKAAIYDAIVGRSIYHRLFWGTSAQAYSRFARLALEAAGDGCFAEAGCGSLLFTAPMYRDFRGPFALLADRSIQMLRRATARIRSRGGDPPERVAFLHADIATLPIRSGIFPSILCLNVLHVPCETDAIIAELFRVLVPGRGRLFVSALVRSGRWSDKYMAALYGTGELGVPRTLDELQWSVGGRWGVIESSRMEGNMSFLVVRHGG
jgi:SAM-dependent methyltransferase